MYTSKITNRLNDAQTARFVRETRGRRCLCLAEKTVVGSEQVKCIIGTYRCASEAL